MNVHKNYIAGEWQGSDEKTVNINPSDLTEVVGEYSRASKEDTDRAIESAKNAFPSWSQSNIQQRSDILDYVGSALLRRKNEIGELLSREEGKTLVEGIGETARAGQIFKFYAAEALRNSGEIISSIRPAIDVEMFREPVGSIGIIAPWNFPIAIPAWKIAPALAFGNCVVFKPAELVPGCSWTIANLLHEAGIPAGVFNLLMGSGAVVGNAIVESSDIDAITFTGSVEVGGQIAVKAVSSSKKIQLEMGGKNPLVVLDDADVDIAVNCAVNSAFFSTGQRCTASSRIIVTQGIYKNYCDALVEKVNTLVVGDALHPQTHIGPVAYEDQLKQDIQYIKTGQEEGGKLIGGELLSRETQGYYLSPALFLDTDNSMRINQEEIFGPVASVIPAKDYEEALAIANDTPFGLSAGICTTSLKYANHFKKNIEAGMAMVNLPTAGVDYHVPFGGCKGSSYGSREQGTYAREFYTRVKTCYIG